MIIQDNYIEKEKEKKRPHAIILKEKVDIKMMTKSFEEDVWHIKLSNPKDDTTE